ncbi:L-2-amino-thiazoline-4-carboxylic acid hydrolase [Allonocardiopsis opalescens]|uniref:L-2-amino-thiazoline-4-carboxylic acid hydrolase-like protein n=1 Tax=Allonocardiopsis opalescens TaxID=1144618 RepID=A0A2T0PZ35_9ACTN|nr:L-2-amino-thiazoline-4-carboxylic acid hydrolase [Allonocardiopsis opalescens]PRX96788.1 L-2-amino-thiazoline-4-carboxylic acid hydrolase-like protein [Allonocardiopsis opalescens]
MSDESTDTFDLTGDDYRPDPDRDTTLLIEGFFDRIARRSAALGLPDGRLDAMRARHTALLAASAHRIVDEPSRHNLRITLALVAAYEGLRPELDGPAAAAELRAALVEPLGEAMRDGTRAMLDAAADPFAAMVAVSKAREEHAFGAAFTFHRPVDDDERYFVDVRHCFYHEVLAAHGAPELTPAMCAIDANWIDAIDPDRHGFAFERATTIGLGGTHCPFHFRRVGPAEREAGPAA